MNLSLVASALLALASSTASVSGTATGGVVQTRHYVSSDGSVVADDVSTYRGTLTFEFRIRANGSIAGSGSGRYLVDSWHETGTVAGAGFSCNAPKTANAFKVVIGGHVANGIVHLSLRLPTATEVLAADVDCGHGHRLVAGTTTYLRDSLTATGGADIHWQDGHPAVLHLSKHEDFTAAAAPPSLPGTFHVVRQNAWTVTVKAPS